MWGLIESLIYIETDTDRVIRIAVVTVDMTEILGVFGKMRCSLYRGSQVYENWWKNLIFLSIYKNDVPVDKMLLEMCIFILVSILDTRHWQTTFSLHTIVYAFYDDWCYYSLRFCPPFKIRLVLFFFRTLSLLRKRLMLQKWIGVVLGLLAKELQYWLYYANQKLRLYQDTSVKEQIKENVLI